MNELTYTTPKNITVSPGEVLQIKKNNPHVKKLVFEGNCSEGGLINEEWMHRDVIEFLSSIDFDFYDWFSYRHENQVLEIKAGSELMSILDEDSDKWDRINCQLHLPAYLLAKKTKKLILANFDDYDEHEVEYINFCDNNCIKFEGIPEREEE